MRCKRFSRLIGGFLTLLFLTAMAGAASAETYNLVAGQTSVAMQDGKVVTVWRFCMEGSPECADGVFSVPVLRVTDNTLTINLSNLLPEPVSLHIPGQTLAAGTGPVWTNFPASDNQVTATGSRASGDFTSRVRSFSHETAPNGSGTYTWSNLRPGSYILQSGTNPAKQVQMGLYAAVVQDLDPLTKTAYAGVPYDREILFFLHEIDPALNELFRQGVAGSSVHRVPRYFLINAKSHPDGSLTPINATNPVTVGEKVLLRFFNAGLETHVPQIEGSHIHMVAEDGNKYANSKEVYGIELPAGKTVDALFDASEPGRFPVYDGRLNLADFLQSPGGMLAYMDVGNVAGAPVAASDSYTTDENASLTVPAAGVLANDTGAGPLTAVLVNGPGNGTLTLNSDGSFSYTPNQYYSGRDIFTYKASDGVNSSNIAGVSISVNSVNQAPTANNDSYSATAGTALETPPPGVLGNDTDPDGDTLTAVLVSGPTNGVLTLNTDGSFTYTAAADYSGLDSFTYTANDGTANSNVATVNITVTAGANTAPVTVADLYQVYQDGMLNVNAPGVLANDTDADGDTLTAVLATSVSHGSLTLNPNGSFTYTPTAGYSGVDSFTYRANDGKTNGNVVAVTISVIALSVNQPPQASNDAYTLENRGGVAFTAQAPGVLDNDTDPDGDPLTAVLGSPPVNGTLVLNANGSFNYTPKAGFSGQDSFTYTAGDGSASSNTATVTLTVTINNPPVAANDSYSIAFYGPFSVAAPGVLQNDTDPNGDPLTAVLVRAPKNGTLTLNADGSFTYNPKTAFVGGDSFTYRANDGKAVSAVAMATIERQISVTKSVYKASTQRWTVEGRSSALNSTITIYLGLPRDKRVIGTAAVNGSGIWKFSGVPANRTPNQGETIYLWSNTDPAGQLRNVPVTID